MTATHRRRRVRGAILVAGACVFALALAACGGGTKSPGVANVGNSHHRSTSSTSPPSGGSPSSSSGGGPGAAGGVHAEMKPVGASVAQELRYAKCMRASGEPNFPDPNSQGAFSFGSAQGIDPGSPQFRTAQGKCAKYIPHPSFSPARQQQLYEQMVRYSQCMRSHGVPSYPDPTKGAGGGVSVSIGGGPHSGLDPTSPIFQRAQQACSKIPGAPPALGAGGK
jgi:hypothetical protein